MKETMKLFIAEYIRVKQLQDTRTDQVFDAVSVLANGPCDYEPMVYPYYRFIEDAMVAIIGPDNAEWINWFLYDCKYLEQQDRNVVIDGVQYNIETVSDLIDHCINVKECNKAFFKRAMK